MRFHDMTDDQKWSYIALMTEQWDAEDNEANKEAILAFNEGISPEAAALHRDALIIDACTFNVVRRGWRIAAAGASALNCTVPDVFGECGEAFKAVANYYQVIREDPRFRLIRTVDDILDAKRQGQTGLIIGAQSQSFLVVYDIESVLEAFCTLGLRVMQIGYNYRTFAADGCFSPANAGLSDTGIELVRLMEKHHVTVDLSHAGERSTLEAMEMAEKPQIFSHSNPMGLFRHPRNITDEQAKKCAATGGVIGVSTYNVTLWDGEHFPTLDTFLNCLCYYCDLVGVEHVGIGLDTTATEGCYSRAEIRYFAKLIRKTCGNDAVSYKAFSQDRPPVNAFSVEGLASMANWVNLIDGMLKRGFTEREIRLLAGENWLKVFRETW